MILQFHHSDATSSYLHQRSAETYEGDNDLVQREFFSYENGAKVSDFLVQFRVARLVSISYYSADVVGN